MLIIQYIDQYYTRDTRITRLRITFLAYVLAFNAPADVVTHHVCAGTG